MLTLLLFPAVSLQGGCGFTAIHLRPVALHPAFSAAPARGGAAAPPAGRGPQRPLLGGASWAEPAPAGQRRRWGSGRKTPRETTPGEQREPRGPSGTAGGERGCGRGGRAWPGRACAVSERGGVEGCVSRRSAVRCATKEAKAGEKRAEPLRYGPVGSCGSRVAGPACAAPERGLGPGGAAPRRPGRGARRGRDSLQGRPG